jgi:hypothetical protein
VQLAGQVGFYQARIQSLEEQLYLLTDTQHGCSVRVCCLPSTMEQPFTCW